jgi:nucleoside-diphosphate-sugar epimerase
MRDCRAVVHLAARVHQPGRSAGGDADYVRVNLHGSEFVAEQALRAAVPRIIFLSSVKVNGEGGARPYGPSDPPDPCDPYGRSKWAAEQALRELCIAGPMELVVVRPPLIYGPGVKANFLRLLRLAASGIPLPLRSVANRRSMIGVSNLVDFIEICLTHPRSPALPWLVSDGEDLSTPDLLIRMRRLMGRPDRMFGVPPVCLRGIAAPFGLGGTIQRLTGTLQVDAAEARRHLAWNAPSTVDAELARTVAAYLKSEAK